MCRACTPVCRHTRALALSPLFSIMSCEPPHSTVGGFDAPPDACACSGYIRRKLTIGFASTRAGGSSWMRPIVDQCELRCGRAAAQPCEIGGSSATTRFPRSKSWEMRSSWRSVERSLCACRKSDLSCSARSRFSANRSTLALSCNSRSLRLAAILSSLASWRALLAACSGGRCRLPTDIDERSDDEVRSASPMKCGLVRSGVGWRHSPTE
mmetsp:Transcript_42784/g.125650  ORF Transcript_42784/g.125650 Transcript_42784/m.125650 type:complete len:211 (+) Transcript_42784:547-1179(+)